MGYPDMMRDILAQARREMIANRKKALESRPIIDHATGLYRQEYFDLRLDEEMSRSRLYGNRLSLILIDASLSAPNDSESESRIDKETLQAIAGIISDCLIDTIGLAFHYGQMRFAVIMPESDEQEAALIADFIQKAIPMDKMPDVALFTHVIQYKGHESIDELIQAG